MVVSVGPERSMMAINVVSLLWTPWGVMFEQAGEWRTRRGILRAEISYPRIAFLTEELPPPAAWLLSKAFRGIWPRRPIPVE
jgi:hypothetical protein